MIKEQFHSLSRVVKFVLLWIVLFHFQSNAQLITKNFSADYLVRNVLVGAGVTVSSVDFYGVPMAVGFFDGSKTNIGLSKGIIITTGTISGNNGPKGPNNSGSAGFNNGAPGNSLLNNLLNSNNTSGKTQETYNAATIVIRFKPMSDTVRFRYVFASEEYPEYVGSQFNDIFAFFISGPGINGSRNIALLPDSTPVSINNVNQNGSNSKYYVNNIGGKTIQYDGFTRVLTAMSKVICGQEYTLTISIADVNDGILDSGIFLEANSLSAQVELGINQSISKDNFNDTLTMAEGCTSGKIMIKKLPNSKDKDYIIPIIYKGSAVKGIDYTSSVQNSITIPMGQDTASFEIISLMDNQKEGTDSIIMDFLLPDACGNTYIQTKKFYIRNIDPIKIDLPDDTIYCVGKGVFIKPMVTGGVNSMTYEWNTGQKTDSIFVNPLVNQQYTLKVSDDCFNSDIKTNTVVVMKYLPLNVAPLANITEICPYLPVKVMANPSQGAGFYRYLWSDGKRIVDTLKEGTLKPSKTTTFTLTVTDRCGEKKSVSMLYTITSPPLIPHVYPDTLICIGDSVQLKVKAVGGWGKYTYKWVPGFDTTSTIWVKPDYKMDYYVYVGDDCKTFSVRDTATIFVNKPIVSFGYTGIPIIEQQINFVNYSPNYPSYKWDFGNGNSSNNRDAQQFYKDSSIYNVKLSVTDSMGCKNSTTQKIQIYNPYSLYIPNTFTPNDDGINDYFMPSLTSVISVDLSIYNRWGEVIFHSNELRPRWDGTYNGVQSPNDLYTYKIQVVSIMDQLETYTGHVTLCR